MGDELSFSRHRALLVAGRTDVWHKLNECSVESELMGESRVESILSSATRLFAERGVAGVSVQEIADQAGVAAGTVIYHFKSKNNLLFILARDILYRLHNQAKEAMENAASPLESVFAFVDSFFTFARNNRDCLVFLTRLDPFTTLDLACFPNADLSLLKDRYIRLIQEGLDRVLQQQSLVDIDTDTMALAVWAILRGVSCLSCENASLPDLSGEVKAMLACRLKAQACGAVK